MSVSLRVLTRAKEKGEEQHKRDTELLFTRRDE
jgi:hypothetical protein